MSRELKQLRLREIYLANLLTLSRAQRRKRGVKIERYRIELELGAVQNAIERLETTETAVEALG